jgi:hypothetical protein
VPVEQGLNIAFGRTEGSMKVFLPLAFSLLMGAAAFAQDPPTSTQQQQSDTSITVVGCLTKGATDGQYMVTDPRSGQKISFIATQPMDSYVNHTVQITGTITSDGSGDRSFTPQTVKTVSDTCSGG